MFYPVSYDLACTTLFRSFLRPFNRSYFLLISSATYQIPQLEFNHSFCVESTSCPIFKSLQFLNSEVYSPDIIDLCEEAVYSENL